MKDLFNNTCIIKEKIEAQGLYGEINVTLNNIQENIPCRLDSVPKSYKVIDNNYKTTIRVYTLFIDKNTLISPLTIDKYIEVNSVDYEIVDVMYFNDDKNPHHIEAYLKLTSNL